MSAPYRTVAVVSPSRGRAGIGRLLGIAVLALLLAAAALVFAAWRDYRHFADAPLSLEADATLDIARGTSYRQIVRTLRREGYTRAAPLYWRLLDREMGVAGRLHAGEYALPVGITPRRLLAKMAAGEVVQHQFTIVDGWTFRQLRVALAQETGLRQTLTTASDAEIAAQLGLADVGAEGCCLPETYAWIKGESDLDVLRRAAAAMRRTLEELWAARVPDLPLKSPYEALILASIVEKETGIASERAEVAGVFVRRLRIGMRLQTDPTVIYGLGEGYTGRLRRRDLDGDTPYNTYTRAGLPPTPIALPGRAAIAATLAPAGGDALYFVAYGDGSGRHEFSATLAEHNRAVARYLERLRR